MSLSAGWPSSIEAVSLRVAQAEQAFDPAVLEFLDYFYTTPNGRVAALADAPVPLDDLRDAYLGAVAEHLARGHDLPVPVWAEDYGMALRRPFFAGGLEGLKATLFVQSPTSFRRRLLFVSHDALSRPRQAG